MNDDRKSLNVQLECGTLHQRANKFLKYSAILLFLIMASGQWIFAVVVASFYTSTAMKGDLTIWNKVFPHAYVNGDMVGNTAVVIHLVLAVVVMLSGALQLIPHVRNYAPKFHHWNGRAYIVAAFLISLGGIFMALHRGTVGSSIGQFAILVNGILIMVCAAMTLRYALLGQFVIHYRWALRLFLVMSGVWLFRVGLMFWIVVNKGPVGFDPETFQGPFLNFLGFAVYVVPLAVLECYFRAKHGQVVALKWLVAALLIMISLLLLAGVVSATLFMWLPRFSL